MDVHAFIMLGQSNMAGRGDFGEVPPLTHPRCKMLRNGRWQPMSEPINPDRPIFDSRFHSGVGLAASFAVDYAEAYPDAIVGLVPCADGGTCLADWVPGGLLYDHAVFQTRLAARTAKIHGIIWHQGESDTHTPQQIDAYRQNFDHFFNAFLADTNLEGIPVVIGELGHFLATATAWGPGIIEGHRTINRIMHQIVQDRPNFALATAEDLTAKPDGIHFNSASLRLFGHRYFAAYQSLLA